MGLFDEYVDPDKFQASGGLLGRMLSLQQQQGQYQPSADFDQTSTAPPAPAFPPMPSPMSPNYGQMSAVPQVPTQDPASQYTALTPVLGDRNATLATVNSDFGKTLDAQTLPGRQKSGDNIGTDPSGNGQAGLGNDTNSSVMGGPPGLSQVGYFEAPTNANQAAGELQSIQQRNQEHTISGKDYVSGVREGNVKRNGDGSLDVTNGTIVTLSYKDGRAKTVTVTNTDIAHIDKETGEVVIQKSPSGKDI